MIGDGYKFHLVTVCVFFNLTYLTGGTLTACILAAQCITMAGMGIKISRIPSGAVLQRVLAMGGKLGGGFRKQPNGYFVGRLLLNGGKAEGDLPLPCRHVPRKV